MTYREMWGQMVLGMVIVLVGQIRTHQDIHPSVFLWWLLLWWFLGLASMFESIAPLATGLGWLILLTVFMRYGASALLGEPQPSYKK